MFLEKLEIGFKKGKFATSYFKGIFTFNDAFVIKKG